MRFKLEQMRSVALSLGENHDHANVIYQNKNRIVFRFHQSNAPNTFIVKMWSRPGIKGLLRRWSQTGSCDYEWRNLVAFESMGVPSPKPFGRYRLPLQKGKYTDAIFMEDLGQCTPSMDYVKSLIASGKLDQLNQFEQQLIEITARIVEGGMVDTDHGLVNTVIRESGQPVRLDLEMARKPYFMGLAWDAYGRMIGHLLATYTYAVQPQTDYTTSFAARLIDQIRPPKRVLKRANRYIKQAMAYQLKTRGVDTTVTLPCLIPS